MDPQQQQEQAQERAAFEQAFASVTGTEPPPAPPQHLRMQRPRLVQRPRRHLQKPPHQRPQPQRLRPAMHHRTALTLRPLPRGSKPSRGRE